MRKRLSNLLSGRRTPARARLIIIALICCLGRIGTISGAEPGSEVAVRVVVYDVAPYGWVGRDGLFYGLSVELWRRVAEHLHLTYRLTLVPQMDVILTGLERGQFDAAIGAITITPGRLARVDFSYPTHRSGVAVAFPKEAGPIAAVLSYGAGVRELSFLIVVILALLLLIGVLMWTFERPRRNATELSDSSVTTLNEGIYWAVVTMTTVGYGDKTPKTPVGRFIAVLWMLGSLALISLLSTSLVAHMTADRVEAGQMPRNGDLEGKRLAAVADSSAPSISKKSTSNIPNTLTFTRRLLRWQVAGLTL